LRVKNGLQKPIFTLKNTHPAAFGGGGEGLGVGYLDSPIPKTQHPLKSLF